MHNNKVAAWVWIFFFMATVSVAASGAVVKAIKIEGNRKIETAAIQSKINTKVGTQLKYALVESDIRSIFSLGYFDDIEVSEEAFAGGVRLVYRVVEKPTIVEINFEGLDELDEDEAKEDILAKKYEVLDIHKLNQSIDALRAKYEEKGYYLAEIRFEVAIDEQKNEAKVTFHIEENDQVKVKRINIIGANVVPSSELKKVMQTQEGGFFSWLTGSGTYREAAFERDVAGMTYYYGTLGYVKARVGKPNVTVSPDKRWITISFSVEEGEQYFVGNVEFSGDLLFTSEELLEDLKLIDGEVFNTDTLRRETLRYTEKYADLGYAFANVVPQPNIHDDTRRVDVLFQVDKGRRVFVGRITITGNTRTKDRVIRRQLKIHEGELFNGRRKRESRENVVRLGYFDSVEFHQTTSKTSPDVVDIEIRVSERSTGQLVIGAGYATGNIGFTAQVQLSQNNFLGSGQIASLHAQILTGSKFYQFQLSLFEPYVGYSNWSLGGDLYHQQRILYAKSSVPTFKETTTGAAIKLGHPVFDYTKLFLTYQFKSAYVPQDSIVDRTLIARDSVNGITSSLTTTVEYDKRDDRYDPRNGWFWSLSSELAGLGGSKKHIKTSANIKFFHPLVWDFIFRFNFKGGNITRLGPGNIAINDLFLQGGLFTLRGYDYYSIGPKRKLSDNPADLSAAAVEHGLAGQSIPYGGHNEVLFNAEIEFPILKDARIRGVLFFDAGNAFDGFFRDVKPALYANAGWGIRWWTPIGPLRFEFGYPIVYGGSPEFHFTIGPPF